ncbi:MAG: hypothetical protein P8Y67_14705 [Alphaproteobacteria bacterium]
MYSGLKQQQAVLHRQRSEAWAWIKARGIFKNRINAAYSKLTSSVLLTTDCSQAEEIASWRDNLAAFNHRSLAQQICEQFFDASILSHSCAPRRVVAAEPVLETFLPENKAKESASISEKADTRNGQGKTKPRARILSAIFPEKKKRSAVLLSIKNRAA